MKEINNRRYQTYCSDSGIKIEVGMYLLVMYHSLSTFMFDFDLNLNSMYSYFSSFPHATILIGCSCNNCNRHTTALTTDSSR